MGSPARCRQQSFDVLEVNAVVAAAGKWSRSTRCVSVSPQVDDVSADVAVDVSRVGALAIRPGMGLVMANMMAISIAENTSATTITGRRGGVEVS